MKSCGHISLHRGFDLRRKLPSFECFVRSAMLALTLKNVDLLPNLLLNLVRNEFSN